MTPSNKSVQDRLAQLEEKLKHQKVIHDFVKEVLQRNSIDEILWSICQNVISKLGLEDCVIYLVDERRNVLVQKAAYGPKNPIDQEIAGQITIPIGQGVVGTVAKTGVSEIIDDTSKDPRYIVDDDFRFSEIAVPIIYDNQVIGVIDSEHSEKGFYTEFHLEMLQTISSLCATRIGYAVANENLKTYKDQLEITVQKRTAELNQANEQLRISNKSLQRYAHIVSHDLKSPLKTISAFIKLIEKKETNLQEKSKEYLDIVKDAANRLTLLLDETLNTSLHETEQSQSSRIDLNLVLNKVVNDLSYAITQNEVTILKMTKLPIIQGFESHFLQIFQNLIANSIKYKQIEKDQKIIISCKKKEGYAFIEFQDFGIGIKPEYSTSIFDLGERRMFDQEGKGIGLHTCKRMIEYYEGSISAHSEGLNKGMTITIKLPLSE